MIAPLTLHLLRHGTPLESGLLLGHRDMPSTAEGEAECAAKARALIWDHMISSDLARCAAPAEQLAQERGMICRFDPRWRELDFGAWDGLHRAVVDQQALSRFWDDADAHPPPQGERLSDFHQRIAAALTDTLAQITSGAALVITHGGAMRAALHLLLGWTPAQCWSVNIGYAAQISLNIWPGDQPAGLPWQGQLQALRP